MLSVASMAAGQCNYYLELGRSDYYLDGGEPPGQWRGQGSEELGLEGRVSKEHLRNLFEGYAPDRGRELVQLGATLRAGRHGLNLMSRGQRIRFTAGRARCSRFEDECVHEGRSAPRHPLLNRDLDPRFAQTVSCTGP